MAAAAAVVVAAAAWFAWLLPRPLFHQPYAAVLEARDATLLGARIAADGQWRFPEAGSVPDRFRRALIAYEDRRFERHPGVDPAAILRALRQNWRAGHVVSGGSTLTMQLARLVRTQDEPDVRRGYFDKLYEALLALRLELRYSKNELLALYASHAPFGGNVVGLDAAAWRYFGRPAQSLSWAEAATLAVLPNSPALVTPGRNRARLQAKRDALLGRLRQQGALDALELRLALAEPLVAEPRDLPARAPHLLATLRAGHPGQQRFLTTLDPELQDFATRVVQQHAHDLQAQGIGNVAALIVDNRSFQVLAYVGNSGWAVEGERALAVDIVQRPRSTGSILKPFLYAAMLDSGQLLPTMLVPDVPTQYQGFSPENFDRSFRGAVPADEALAQSLNVPAVRELKDYGIARFHDLLRALGMSTLSEPPDHYGLTLVLGGAEATLWDVTRMHATLAALARQGETHGSTPDALQVLADAAPALQRAPLSPAAAWLTLDALLEVARPAEEANWQEFASAHRIAWKTGTSWGLRDAWAVGSTSRYTVGVWAGNADGAGVPGLTGSQAAAPVLFELMNRLPAADWFDKPVRAMKRVQVCSDDGYLASELCTATTQWAPADSHFDRQSPYHQLAHLDAGGRWRVDAGCEPPGRMRHEPWLVLPPAQAYYYRRTHASYRELPAYRSDCHPEQSLRGGRGVMDFLYPNASDQIYVPIDLDGHSGRVVFEAVHRDAQAVIYWHLDDEFLGRTQTLHQMSLALTPGEHLLTIVDAAGNRVARQFTVLARPR